MSNFEIVELNTGVILERKGRYYVFIDVSGENYITYYNVVSLDGSGRLFQTPKILDDVYEEIRDDFTIVGKLSDIEITQNEKSNGGDS